jgi:BASS family bile acid:Na+ symporter
MTFLMIAALTNGFPVWVLAASLAALWRPSLFTWFSGPLITIGLAVIMLGMGLTLSLDDARRVADRRLSLGLGVVLQYTVMPSLGWGLSIVYGLPTPFAVGLILVACCPGGTASNVISYLARVDVALSVAMTAASTILAVIVTPLLTALLAGSRIEVPMGGLLLSTAQVVVLPLVLAAALNRWTPRATRLLVPVSPLLAVLMITLIVASIIGAGREAILQAGPRLLLAIASLHAGGFLVGYVFSRVMRADVRTARTISIEVGMQNSGLGVVLARSNFADPLVAIPSAISSLFHSLIASLLAAVWRARPTPAVRSSSGAHRRVRVKHGARL